LAAYRDPVAAFFDRQVNERFGSSDTADRPQFVPQEVSQIFRRLYRDACENVVSSRGYHYPRDFVQFRDRLRGFVDFVGINLNADNCLGRVTQPAGIEQSNDVDELRVDQSLKPSSHCALADPDFAGYTSVRCANVFLQNASDFRVEITHALSPISNLMFRNLLRITNNVKLS